MNAPYKYDIVGSFLRDKEIKQAREEFALGKITLQQLEEVENKSIENLVNEEKAVGLKAVTDGEFRSFLAFRFFMGFKRSRKSIC